MNLVKKWKLWVAVAVLAVTAFMYEGNLIVARAEATATVKAESAKIRSEASTSSEAVGSTTKGTKLPVLKSVTATDGIWYQVTVEGNTTGFIRSDLVSVSGDVPSAGSSSTQEPTVTSSEVVASDMTSGLITKNSVNVRKGASTTDALAGTLRKDAVVTITGETTGADGKTWYQIESEEVSGYIRSDLIEASAAVAVEGGNEEETVSDPGVEEGTEVTQQPDTSVEAGNYTDVSNVIATRKLPEGADLESLDLGAEVVKSWESERYYIIYTKTKSGIEQWYLYDAESNVYERVNALTPMSAEEIEAEGGKGNTVLTIVLAAIIVILIGVIVYLALQLRDYQMDYEYDDEEDDDEYYEGYEEGRVNSRAWKPKNFLGRDDFDDDMEDDMDDDVDEEEIEEEQYRRPVRRQQAAPVRESAPRQQVRPANSQARPANSQARPVNGQSRPANGQSRPANGQARPANGQARPANGQSRPTGAQPRPEARQTQRPATKPARQMAYDDAEDEDFEFEFLNMSDEDYID